MCEVHGLLYNNIIVALLSICDIENSVLTPLLMLMLSLSISKCFSLFKTLQNPLTRVEEDTLVLTKWKKLLG